MCLSCRKRSRQKEMVRLQHVDSEVVAYRGFGRSFYVCNECIDNNKKIKGLTKRFKQDGEQFVKFLKELVKYG